MAYYTGIANTVNELLSALQNACTANGWALQNSVLSKNNCYVKPYINGVTIAMQGAADSAFSIKSSIVSHAGLGINITYPLTYHIHVNDMEVYFFINFNVDRYSYLGFGQSPAGNISGTGNWVFGLYGGGSTISLNNTSTGREGAFPFMPFTHISGYNIYTSFSFIHHGVNGQWSGNSSTEADSKAIATLENYPAMMYQPNAWNGQSVLIPIRPMIYQAAGRWLLVGELKSAFYVRVDNYDPGQIITIGDQRFKIYPWILKNTADRNCTVSASATRNYSGTFGVAVLYDGD